MSEVGGDLMSIDYNMQDNGGGGTFLYYQIIIYKNMAV